MSFGTTDIGTGTFSTDGFIPSATGPSSAPTSIDLDDSLVKQTKTQIRQLVAEIAQLSQLNLSPQDYFNAFLPKVTAALGAIGGAVWQKSNDSNNWTAAAIHQLPPGLAVEIESNIDSKPGKTHYQAAKSHIDLLDCVYREQQPVLIPPGSIPLNENRPANPTEHLIIIIPITQTVTEERSIQIEVIQRPSGGPATHRGYLRFVAQMADLAMDYLKSRRLSDLRNQRLKHAAFRDLTVTLHSNVVPHQRWHYAAKHLADVTDSTQATILIHSNRFGRKQWKILGISSIPNLDHRGSAASLINQWAQAQTLQIDQWPAGKCTTIDVNRQPTSLAARYHHMFDAAWSMWLPITEIVHHSLDRRKSDRHTIVGAILLHGSVDCTSSQEAETIPFISHIEPILSTAISNESYKKRLSFRSHQNNGKPGRSKSERIATWIIRIATLSIFAVVLGWPVPDRVFAPAILRPAAQQVCYAPSDAVVKQVLVKHDQIVSAGDILLVLVDRYLETELEDLIGKQAEAENELARIDKTLLRGSSLDALETAQLEGEQRRWKSLLKTYHQQRQILRQRQDSLTIRASRPGRISTWQVESRLQDRPVRMGQMLLSLYDTDQYWLLEAEIPQRRAAQVIESQNASEQPLPIQFTLNADPSKLVSGSIESIHRQISLSLSGEPVLRLTAKVNERELWLKKDGAAAEAAIDCGNQAFGWILIRDAWQSIYGRLRLWV